MSAVNLSGLEGPLFFTLAFLLYVVWLYHEIRAARTEADHE